MDPQLWPVPSRRELIQDPTRKESRDVRTPWRFTKIVATLGPSTDDERAIARVIEAGVDVVRFNFSHGAHADHQRRMDAVRAIETRVGRPIAVMADLQGPKLRVGTFRDGAVALTAGQGFRLDLDPTPGDRKRAHLPHPEIFRAIEPGHVLMLDDGKVRLQVHEKGPDFIQAVVLFGTRLSDRKGVNVPDTVLDLSALSDKDRRDLDFALAMGVDWVALSFVQRPEDLLEARRLIGDRASLLVKIEKPSAVQHLDDLVAEADAAMVARGDLGVELPPEDVPGLQKRIVRTCRRHGKPVIVATQMLESMISAPLPTRAEASDVATAVYDGADGVMLSAETAAGQYPVEAVEIMDRIIARVERDPLYRTILDAGRSDGEPTASDAITASARHVAETIDARAVVTFTTSGSTTLRAARERPGVPILCLTPGGDTARRMAMAWGVRPMTVPDVSTLSEMVEQAIHCALEQGVVLTGDRLVMTAGLPIGIPGNTNVLRIVEV